jgi:hypothetical protein
MFFCQSLLPSILASIRLSVPPTLGFSVEGFFPLVRESRLKAPDSGRSSRSVCHICALTPEYIFHGTPQGEGARIYRQNPT